LDFTNFYYYAIDNMVVFYMRFDLGINT